MIQSPQINPLSEKELLRKAKKLEKEAEKAAKVSKALKKKENIQKRNEKNSESDDQKNSKVQKNLRSKEFVSSTILGEKKDLNEFPLDEESSYHPQIVESAWYSWWEKKGFFNPDLINKDSNRNFSIVIPPPNVTGSLHLGHTLMASIQDCLVRYRRMKGDRVVWIPGIDHAGIATQAVVEKRLWKEQKKLREDLSRKEFLDLAWDWKMNYGNRITNQLRRIGSSLDWSRERFTMDERLSKAVVEAFVRLSRCGKIYRGTRLVNWSCKLQTAISDIEVDNMEISGRTKLSIPGYTDPVEFGLMWNFAYKVKDLDEEIVVATTRPETMLGDVAVAIHPQDNRYKHLHNKEVLHPFFPDRKMLIILDSELVDMNLGTGAVKITPAHDPNDYACGERHKLARINILNKDGTINEIGGPLFAGQPRYRARKMVLKELEKLGLLRGTEDKSMIIGRCSRSGDVVEPLLIPQWWVKCDEMAKSALKSVESGELKIHPPNFISTWNSWLSGIRDWCISRQLWWGHRIPAWLVSLENCPNPDSSCTDSWIVARNEEEALRLAQEKFKDQKILKLEQDHDVLDTWFSSALFPFSVFGWPDVEDNFDFDTYFPTSLLETGHDILFFWVARMVMMSLELTGKLPFKNILLHAMVRDSHGRKMSKALGNVIDPIDVIEGITQQQLIDQLYTGNLDSKEIKKATEGIKGDFPKGIGECGTDALRFTLLSYTQQCRDINLDVQRIQANRNFCNKIWNATKLVFMSLGWLKKSFGNTKINNNNLDNNINNNNNLDNNLDNNNNNNNDNDRFIPLKYSERWSKNPFPINNWIISRLNHSILESDRSLEKYDFANACNAIYSFFYYDFCDTYLEAIKPIFNASLSNNSSNELVEHTRQTLYTCLEQTYLLLHPYMPYLTEELWQRLERRSDQIHVESITIAPYPECCQELIDEKIEFILDHVQSIAHAARSMKFQYQIPRKNTPDLIVNFHSKELMEKLNDFKNFIQTLSLTGSIEFTFNSTEVPRGAAVNIPNDQYEIYLLLKDLVNVQEEIEKLNTKLENLTIQKKKLLSKIESPEFEKIPQNVREATSSKLKAVNDEIESSTIAINNFKNVGH